MLPSIFRKMHWNIRDKVESGDASLYLALAFPILFVFTLTFIGARIFSHLWPQIYIEWSPGLRVHHFTYGFFILATSGYIGLAVKRARAKFWVAMFHGLGLGLAMDEFGMWLRLRDDDIARWSYDGLMVTIGIFLLIFTAKPGVRLLKKLWPGSWFRKLPETNKI